VLCFAVLFFAADFFVADFFVVDFFAVLFFAVLFFAVLFFAVLFFAGMAVSSVRGLFCADSVQEGSQPDSQSPGVATRFTEGSRSVGGVGRRVGG
jgi:hypothetical protein